MRVNYKKIKKQNDGWKRENFGREKQNGRETETDKEKNKKFQWTEEMVQYLLDSLKRHIIIRNFSRKDFDANETVQYSKLWKEMAKKYEDFGPVGTLANPKADLRFRRRRNLKEK